MKIVVTGALGQIGSYVFENLKDKHKTVGIDLKKSKNVDSFIQGDLRDYDFVENVIRKCKPDAVIHLAAQVSVENSWKDPIHDAENNIIATLNLLKACTEYDVEKFISAAVYGNPRYVPIDEEHPLNPISPYGVSKLTGEYYYNFFE